MTTNEELKDLKSDIKGIKRRQEILTIAVLLLAVVFCRDAWVRDLVKGVATVASAGHELGAGILYPGVVRPRATLDRGVVGARPAVDRAPAGAFPCPHAVGARQKSTIHNGWHIAKVAATAVDHQDFRVRPACRTETAFAAP